MRLSNGSPSVDFNGTRYTSIEGTAADNNISIDNVRGKGRFNPLTEPGIALTTQQAQALGVKVGDKVSVRDNNVDQALRALKKKLQREGVFREMKLKQHFEKPSVKKAREKAEAVRRARKLARKKLQREGGL